MKKILLLLVLFTLLTSCRTIYKTIEVPVKETETEYIYKYVHDSIYVDNNSTTVIKGDTVTITKEKTIIKYQYIADTLIVVDSIPYAVTVTEIQKVNELHDWQKTLMWIGAGCILLGVILLTIKIYGHYF